LKVGASHSTIVVVSFAGDAKGEDN
jgi:hypothetical protein